jgi:hypothetical protein
METEITQELSARQREIGIFLPPDIVLENARTAARALADVISNKKKPVIMNGEQYLEFEDWQTAGQFYGYTVKTGEAIPVEVDGVKGAKACADLIDIKTGLYLGGAEAYCMRDEEHWNTRPKYEWQGEGDNRKRIKVGDEIVPWFQLASMAQTRAGAKAFRNRLAWVVVLAGYRPTPAEEMSESTVSEAVKERRTIDKTSHYCPIHNVNFFKKGRMKGYAHPIEGTDEWCNEDTIQKETEKVGTAASTTLNVEQVSPSLTKTKSADIDRIMGKLNELNKKVPHTWTISKMVAAVANMGGQGKTVKQMIISLPIEKQVELESQLDKDLEMI